MRQPICASALLAVVVIGVVLAAPASAQERASQDTISSLPLPGGLAAARVAVGDTGHADTGQFLVDVIRRSFQTPVSVRGLRREIAIRPLLDHLEKARKAPRGTATDQWPLPLPAAVWTASILDDRASAETLISDILRSPSASLMYCALLALDDPTRRWLAEHPALLSEVAARHAAQFLVAAPGLRIHDNVMRLPGGPAATAAWEAAAGKRATEPAEFVKAVVGRTDPALSFLIGTVPQLTPAQTRFVLNLDGAEAVRVSALRRVLAAFDRVATGWDIADRPFWRPTLDPVLLASDLRTDGNGLPVIPGTAAFWSAVFSGGDADRETTAEAVSTLVSGPPVEFSWLCEQVFNGGQTVIRSPYHLVLFASRRIPAVTAGNARAALAALRGASQFPALAGMLERMRVADLEVYGAAAGAARMLSGIEDEMRAQTAFAQFQGAVAMLARAVTRGGLSSDRAARLVATLSALRVDPRGEYGGAVVEWLTTMLREERQPAAAVVAAATAADDQIGAREDDLLSLLSGPPAERASTLEWEGTKYRVSFASAEALRLQRVLGDAPYPYVSAADAMFSAAKALESAAISRQALTALADSAARLAEATHCADKDDWTAVQLGDRCRDVTTALARAAQSGDVKNARRIAPRLRQLSDVLLARGLMVLSYAAGIGQPENAPISALDAASRHHFGFGLPGFGRAGAWRWPAAGADRVRDWHLTGSMLGIDVALSQFAIVRISNRPPMARPSVSDEDRVVLTESIVLMEPDRLTAEGHAAIVQAMKRGRERVAAMASRADAEHIADVTRMPAPRRALFLWSGADDPRRGATFLSASDVLAVGLEGLTVPASLDDWGVSGEPRTGCHCLQLPGRPFDLFTGRWFSGVLATGFTDLNIRLAEILDQMHMPGALLAPVLASAMWDFVMNVRTNDFDDRNGWIEFAGSLGVDRVEQYLALLTTDGPLVPVTEGSSSR
jgi:hypothetical protein